MDRVTTTVETTEWSPELPHLVAAQIMTLQAKQEGPYDYSLEVFTDTLNHFKKNTWIALKSKVWAINVCSTNYRFNHDQAMQLALMLLEQHGQPKKDQSRFVAMGGMPADDDDDVVFVQEINPTKDAKEKLAELTQAARSTDRKSILARAYYEQAGLEQIKGQEVVDKAQAVVDKAEALASKRHKKMITAALVAQAADIAMIAAREVLAKLEKR